MCSKAASVDNHAAESPKAVVHAPPLCRLGVVVKTEDHPGLVAALEAAAQRRFSG